MPLQEINEKICDIANHVFIYTYISLTLKNNMLYMNSKKYQYILVSWQSFDAFLMFESGPAVVGLLLWKETEPEVFL